MTKKASIFTTGFISILFFSCSHTSERIQDNNSFELEYVSTINKFPKELIEHFPKTISSPAKYSSGFDSKYNAINMELNLMITEEHKPELLKYLKINSKHIYTANDTCLLIVNRFTRMTNEKFETAFLLKIARSTECTSDYVPVPNFWASEYKSKSLSNSLNGKFKHYILDAKSGIYWDGLHRNSGRYMPDSWKHGFSRGVSLSIENNIVIYWLIIW